MLSAERSSTIEIRRRSQAYKARVRSSIVQAATVPYGVTDGVLTALEPRLSTTSEKRRLSAASAADSNKVQGLRKFEVVLDRMKKVSFIKGQMSTLDSETSYRHV